MSTNAKEGAAAAPGLTWSAIRTPDPEDPVRPAIVGGAIGWALALLAGAQNPGRMLAAGLGVAAGALAARYRVQVDWNPTPSPDVDVEIPVLEPEPTALIDEAAEPTAQERP